MSLPPDHPPVRPRKIGVLLTNLGTPDGPDVKSVRRYLLEFLSDRRVVEIPPIAWQPILRGIILNTRPKKSAEAYAQVWGPDGSPLATITKAQSNALQGAFGDQVMVDWAMRYGKPTVICRNSASTRSPRSPGPSKKPPATTPASAWGAYRSGAMRSPVAPSGKPVNCSATPNYEAASVTPAAQGCATGSPLKHKRRRISTCS